LKTLGGIGAMILGVVAILVSVGLQTIWAPPAVFNATTQTTEDAPLTVITEGVDIDPDEAIEYTMSGDGEFTLMYGQLRDIEAWVGDTAHNRIDGIDTDVARGEDPSVNVSFVDGEAEAPDPTGSDLWVASQEVTDEVTQRWARSDAGEWALLVAVDGTEPAPTAFSASWVNVEPDSPLIVPLMIAGIVLILLGLGLFIWRFLEFRRRAKRTSGRRAAVRGDYTGLTAADVMGDQDTSTQTMTVEQVDTGAPVAEYDDDQATEIVAAPTDADESESSEDPYDAAADDDDTDEDDSDAGGSGATPSTATAADETTPLPNSDDDNDQKDHGFLRRTLTVLTALGLTAGVGIAPAQAATETPAEEDISDQVDQEQLEEEVDPDEPETFPVVVDAQLEDILAAVASTVERGDQEGDADLITGRVAGQALRVRQDSYRNHAINDDYPVRADVASEEILATWMDRDDAFPRTIYTVTSNEDGSATQLLVLRQADPRSQYQLIQNAPFAPGAELPGGNLKDHNVERLPADESDELAMSPDAAVEALTQYLTDPDADEADSIADNEWIDLVHEHQDALVEQHAENDVDVEVTRNVFEDSVNSVRLPDGSALVFGAMNSMESLTPTDDATVNLDPLSQEIGDFDSAEQGDRVRIRYREQFALLIPQEGKISLVGYETVQSTVDSPDN